MSGTNTFLLPSPHHTSIISFPVYCSNASHPCLSEPPIPASLVPSSSISSFPVEKFSFPINTNYNYRCDNRDGMKTKVTFSKGPDCVTKARKRPALKVNKFLKPMKKPNLSILDDLASVKGSKEAEQVHVPTQCTMGLPVLHPYGDKLVEVGDIAKDAFISAHGTNSFKLDSGSRSGPIKLSAGAKHILKPGQNMDSDNCRPIHSTIPFAMGTSSGNIGVSDKKSAKIYQF